MDNRRTWAALIILIIGIFILSSGITIAAQEKAAAQTGGSDFCKTYCQAHKNEHGGMGKCVQWCRYYYFEQSR